MIPDRIYAEAMSAGYIPIPMKDGKPQWQKDALSPGFWQALGRTLGWTMDERVRVDRFNAHEFLDLILTGSDTEKFWDEILSTL